MEHQMSKLLEILTAALVAAVKDAAQPPSPSPQAPSPAPAPALSPPHVIVSMSGESVVSVTKGGVVYSATSSRFRGLRSCPLIGHHIAWTTARDRGMVAIVVGATTKQGTPVVQPMSDTGNAMSTLIAKSIGDGVRILDKPVVEYQQTATASLTLPAKSKPVTPKPAAPQTVVPKSLPLAATAPLAAQSTTAMLLTGAPTLAQRTQIFVFLNDNGDLAKDESGRIRWVYPTSKRGRALAAGLYSPPQGYKSKLMAYQDVISLATNRW